MSSPVHPRHYLLHRFDSEFLAVNMDPSNFRLYDNDVPWAVRRLGSKIRHVHLKDVVGRPGASSPSPCWVKG